MTTIVLLYKTIYMDSDNRVVLKDLEILPKGFDENLSLFSYYTYDGQDRVSEYNLEYINFDSNVLVINGRAHGFKTHSIRFPIKVKENQTTTMIIGKIPPKNVFHKWYLRFKRCTDRKS